MTNEEEKKEELAKFLEKTNREDPYYFPHLGYSNWKRMASEILKEFNITPKTKEQSQSD